MGQGPLGTMAGFKGQAEYSVDNKGRVAIPAKMRSALDPEADGVFTATRGLEQCVFLYPFNHWKEKEEEIRKLNQNDRDARAYTRRILMWAEDVKLDGQGRIMIPKALMDFAGIREKALILGAFDRLEIWDPETFEQYLNAQPVDYETLAERVMGM